LLKQKVAQKVAIILGYFIVSKNHNEPPKVAKICKKIAQSGHPDLTLLVTHSYLRINADISLIKMELKIFDIYAKKITVSRCHRSIIFSSFDKWKTFN
jgi:hypothetical protein